MKAEEFDLIKNDLSKRVTDCETYLSNLHTTSDIANLTISQAIEVRDFCKSEYIDMTKIVMVDFYHIIGMGNLNAVQTNIFISLMRKYLSYRSLIQTINTCLTGFDNLPGIPVRSSFKLTTLAPGLELISGPAEGYLQQDTCEIADYHKAKAASEAVEMPPADGSFLSEFYLDKRATEAPKSETSNSIVYIDEKTISGSCNDLEALKLELINLGISSVFANTVIASLVKGCSEIQCAGIKWKAVGNTFVGTAKSDLAKSMFMRAYLSQKTKKSS